MTKAPRTLVVAVIAATLLLAVTPTASPQTSATLIRVTETSAWSPPSPDPSGIGYDPRRNRLFVVDGEVEETPHWDDANVWLVDTAGNPSRTWSTVDFMTEPTGVAIVGGRTMWITDDDAVRVFRWRTGRDGAWGTSDDKVSSFATKRFGCEDPEGIAIGGGSMFVVDGTGQEIFRIDPGDNGKFDGVGPRGDDEVTSFSTVALGIDDPEGVTYDPATGDLFAVSRKVLVIAQMTVDGVLVLTMDISSSGILRPSDITLAPGSDAPDEMHAFVTDRRKDNSPRHPNENDGRIYEFALG